MFIASRKYCSSSNVTRERNGLRSTSPPMYVYSSWTKDREGSGERTRPHLLYLHSHKATSSHPTVKSLLQFLETVGSQSTMAAAAAATLSLPKLIITNHRTTKRRLPKSVSSAPTNAINSQSPSKDLCLNVDEKLPLSALFNFQLINSASLPLTALALSFFLDSQDAVAVEGQFGILEGRTLSLVHPIVMAGLFLHSLRTGYLGLKIRRTRTIQDEISELKKQLKPHVEGQPHQPSPLQAKIDQLTEERKDLVKGSYKDKHFNAGSILLGFGVLEAVYGATNTWIRTGKLFPGPHLFAGATITVLWAVAASLVAPMQKGNLTARNLHIALNSLNLLLFTSQIPTGIKILRDVLGSTSWL